MMSKERSLETTVAEKASSREADVSVSEKTLELEFGTIAYKLTGEANPDHNPVIWFAGHEQSLVNTDDAALLLAADGNRQVLTMGQFIYKDDMPKKLKLDPQFALDAQAKAYLAAAEDAGLIGEDKIVDSTSHSWGTLIMARAKQLAEERGIDSFRQEKGAHLVIMGGSGSRSRESKGRIALRWTTDFMLKTIADSKALDPTGEKGKAIVGNFMADIPKSIGEIRAMGKFKTDFEKLGPAMVIIYPEDGMFPENSLAPKGLINTSLGMERHLSFATPVDPGEVAYSGAKLWLNKRNPLPTSKSRQKYALTHRAAGHNEPTDNPRRTVRTLLQYFDGQPALLEQLKEADKRHKARD